MSFIILNLRAIGRPPPRAPYVLSGGAEVRPSQGGRPRSLHSHAVCCIAYFSSWHFSDIGLCGLMPAAPHCGALLLLLRYAILP